MEKGKEISEFLGIQGQEGKKRGMNRWITEDF